MLLILPFSAARTAARRTELTNSPRYGEGYETNTGLLMHEHPFMMIPDLIAQHLKAVSFSATPIALFDVLSLGFTQATRRCMSICCHSVLMMFERRKVSCKSKLNNRLQWFRTFLDKSLRFLVLQPTHPLTRPAWMESYYVSNNS